MKFSLMKFAAPAAAAVLLLTGCSSYDAGVTDDGIYINSDAGFSIVTPESYSCLSSDHYNDCGYYLVNMVQAKARGAGDSWQCEYAAKALGNEVLVCSEENVKDCTIEEYAQSMGDQLKVELTGLELKSVSDVSLGGKIFKKVEIASDSAGINLYICEAGNSFIYIHHSYIVHEWTEGVDQEFLDSVRSV